MRTKFPISYVLETMFGYVCTIAMLRWTGRLQQFTHVTLPQNTSTSRTPYSNTQTHQEHPSANIRTHQEPLQQFTTTSGKPCSNYTNRNTLPQYTNTGTTYNNTPTHQEHPTAKHYEEHPQENTNTPGIHHYSNSPTNQEFTTTAIHQLVP